MSIEIGIIFLSFEFCPYFFLFEAFYTFPLCCSFFFSLIFFFFSKFQFIFFFYFSKTEMVKADFCESLEIFINPAVAPWAERISFWPGWFFMILFPDWEVFVDYFTLGPAALMGTFSLISYWCSAGTPDDLGLGIDSDKWHIVEWGLQSRVLGLLAAYTMVKDCGRRFVIAERKSTAFFFSLCVVLTYYYMIAGVTLYIFLRHTLFTR